MLLLLVFSLMVASGLGTTYKCYGGGPECPRLVSEEAARKYDETGNLLPSNEFLQENCPSIVESLQCVRDYIKECSPRLEEDNIDMNAVADAAIEFCDEESDLRTGYVANVDCFNRVDIRRLEYHSCVISVVDTLNILPRDQRSQELSGRNITRMCLFVLALRKCAVQIAENKCGEDAAQFIAETGKRIGNVYSCKESDAEAAEEFVAELQSKLEAGDYDCDNTVPACLWRSPFAPQAVQLYEEDGNIFPSDEVLKETCSYTIGHVKCLRGYGKACSRGGMDIITETFLSEAEEFCNEESDVRKAYVANVDCVNQLNLKNHSCFTSYLDVKAQLDEKDLDRILYNRAISSECVKIHIVKPCALDAIKTSCGEEAQETFSEVASKFENLSNCEASDAKVIDEILARLNSPTPEGD